ncbi:MAG: hypothetical protein LIV11_07105 [Bacillota bacterium]|nr:hypothetical protein [Bacillota bacterium]
MDTLGYRNKESNDLTRLKHYAFVLNQWVSGVPIERMVADQIVQNEEINRLHEEDPIRNKKHALVKYRGHYVVFEKTPEHVNALIGNMLEDIEDIILSGYQTISLGFPRNIERCTRTRNLWIGMSLLSTDLQILPQSGFKETASRVRLRHI